MGILGVVAYLGFSAVAFGCYSAGKRSWFPIVAIIITLGPPIWFMVEAWWVGQRTQLLLLDGRSSDAEKEEKDEMARWQDLARPIWAAIAAMFAVLYMEGQPFTCTVTVAPEAQALPTCWLCNAVDAAPAVMIPVVEARVTTLTCR